MKVMVVGKESASGTSKKTGKAFAATIAHISFKKAKCEGSAVESVWLDPVEHPMETVIVGKTYNLDRDNRGYVIGFEPV